MVNSLRNSPHSPKNILFQNLIENLLRTAEFVLVRVMLLYFQYYREL